MLACSSSISESKGTFAPIAIEMPAEETPRADAPVTGSWTIGGIACDFPKLARRVLSAYRF